MALVVWAGLMMLALGRAQLPPEAEGLMLVLFPPGLSESEAFAALVRAGGEPVRRIPAGFAWVVRGREAGFVGRLKAQGALAAFTDLPITVTLGGCVALP